MNIPLKIKILESYPSQAAFAQDVGIHDTKLSGIIRGWRKPNPELREIMAQKLNCEADEIFPPQN